MKQRIFNKALNATRLLMLVIAVSLAILPVSGSHAMMQMDQSMVSNGSILDHHQMSVDNSSMPDCEKHSSSSKSMDDGSMDNCCAAFCVTYTVTELDVIASMPVFRPVYNIVQYSAVLPGEFATPHRPPNV